MMLGTAQFGMNYGIANISGKPSGETVKEIIRTAFENGVNCLDTAPAYGDSETIIGKVLAELGLKEKMHVISKVKVPQDLAPGMQEEFITSSVENSLRRLRVERLAACLFHRTDDLCYLEIMRKLETRGLVGGVGVSLDDNRDCQEVIDLNLQYIQLPYNIFEHRFDKFFAALPRNGRPIIFARSAYLQGLLLMLEEQISPALSCVKPVRHQLSALATASGMDMAELCLRFVLSNPHISSVLVGVDNIRQLELNLKIIRKGVLPPDLLTAIRTAVPLFDEHVVRPSLWSPNACR